MTSQRSLAILGPTKERDPNLANKCPTCQADNAKPVKFCGECGTKLDAPAAGRPLGPEDRASFTRTLDTTADDLTRGTTFAGRYEIIEELGAGGMGRVYRAHDTKLNEEVALKLIRSEIGADKRTVERFRNELKTARKITHKNVCRVYDFHEEGKTLYLTMEYVRGEDLKSLIHRTRAINVGAALSIARQVAEGLGEAHKLGITHRDLKPGNIMIDRDGQAKVMDFGIARVKQEKGITGEGAIIGTPEYMSPEQVEGKPADPRSDIYSVGVILFEMIVGRAPFEGDTPFSVANKHKTEPPPIPRKLAPQIPEGLNKLILRCLEKDRAKRYQTAEELAADLSTVEQALPATDRALPQAKSKTSREITVKFTLRKLIIPAAAAGLLVVAAGIVLLTSKGSAKVYDSIAVMPFVISGGDPGREDIADALTDEFTKRIYQVTALRVKPTAVVLPYRKNPKLIREAGRELGVKALVMSRATLSAGRLRIVVELVDTETETLLWTDTYDEEMSDIVILQGRVAQDVARNVRVRLTPDEQARLAKSQKVSPEAYEKYLAATNIRLRTPDEEFLREGPLAISKKALALIKEAISLEPDYAKFHALAANLYFDLHVFMNLIPFREIAGPLREEIEKTLSLDPDSTDALSVQAIDYYLNHQWKNYMATLREATKRSPSDLYLGANYIGVLYSRGDAKAVEEELARIHLIESAYDPDKTMLMNCCYYARRYDDLLKFALENIRKNGDSGVWLSAAFGYALKGMRREAIDAVEKLRSFMKNHPWTMPATEIQIAWGLAIAGERESALRLMAEFGSPENRELLGTSYDFVMACVLAAKGDPRDREEAFRFLDSSVADPHMFALTYDVEPSFDSLRSDPRFAAIIKKAGFPIE